MFDEKGCWSSRAKVPACDNVHVSEIFPAQPPRQFPITEFVPELESLHGMSPLAKQSDPAAGPRQVSLAQVKPKTSRKQREPPAAVGKKRKIQIPDGVDEKCFKCKRISRDNRARLSLGEVGCCDMVGRTAAWHAYCLGVASLELLPDPLALPRLHM